MQVRVLQEENDGIMHIVATLQLSEVKQYQIRGLPSCQGKLCCACRPHGPECAT